MSDTVFRILSSASAHLSISEEMPTGVTEVMVATGELETADAGCLQQLQPGLALEQRRLPRGEVHPRNPGLDQQPRAAVRLRIASPAWLQRRIGVSAAQAATAPLGCPQCDLFRMITRPRLPAVAGAQNAAVRVGDDGADGIRRRRRWTTQCERVGEPRQGQMALDRNRGCRLHHCHGAESLRLGVARHALCPPPQTLRARMAQVSASTQNKHRSRLRRSTPRQAAGMAKGVRGQKPCAG
jgi:hypothetical protein